MIKDIIQVGDKRLLEKSEPINLSEISSGKVQSLAVDLLDTLKRYYQNAAGLSAVQIGVLKRMFVVRRMDLEKDEEESDEEIEVGAMKWEVMINPQVEVIQQARTNVWEGCMSISTGNLRLYGPVLRPNKVKVEYYDLNGERKNLAAEGFFSHLIQHENDHLEGVLFLNYIKNPKNVWNEDELNMYLRKYNKYPPIA